MKDLLKRKDHLQWHWHAIMPDRVVDIMH
ncbi:hypothetical protein Godav_003861 [Gossypium davidsonii]|uniref:Uncharacterized protein n=1 Tax=Gossypium davidsonii TaxID=34287 RepID=A0A7J8SJW7_GOSDV|nr:hypothetical protein [Gossypium davidsonii]